MAIAEWVEPRVALDHAHQHPPDRLPALLRAALHRRHRPARGAGRRRADSEDTVDGFHVFIGGGFGQDAAIAREIYRDVPAERCPALIERMLRAYLAHRAGSAETFQQFARRHEVEALRSMIDAERGAA